ncbi:MAG: redoxin domain-containing protein [Anaerolineae bacterium]|nr:redoxin domain-containing protein [Anaerolineae bacterium]MDW8299646.1 redoxin domain-containing protein [Anaerolineae bacterium]
MTHENKPLPVREPLPYGRLTPDFRLESVTGTLYSREQFRGKRGLVLLFLPQAEPLSAALLRRLKGLWSEFVEINVQVLAIFDARREALMPLAQALDLPFPVLADADNHVWQLYTHEARRGAALFVLDTYGALSAQRVLPSVADLPEADEILDLARYTQYRCSA